MRSVIIIYIKQIGLFLSSHLILLINYCTTVNQIVFYSVKITTIIYQGVLLAKVADQSV